MDRLFLTILNMSLTGAFVVAAICLARLSLKRAPKIISYCLWAVAGIRLVFPFSIESVFSLIPFKAQVIPPDIAMQSVPQPDPSTPLLNDALGSALPASPAGEIAATNPLVALTTVGTWVWLVGAAAMLVFGVGFYIRLKRQMSSAIRVENNLYEIDTIRSPFVLGVLKPKIYIPLNLAGQERDYVVMHERTHIRRYDHVAKFAAYFILCLHWFNPLAWAAFLLMSLDMEMSCDERVLKALGGKANKDYSLSLLSLASDRRVISGSPLAFGEDGVKRRIKNVLMFKQSSRVTVALAIALVAVLSSGLLVSKASTDLSETPATQGQAQILRSDLPAAPDDVPAMVGEAQAAPDEAQAVPDEAQDEAQAGSEAQTMQADTAVQNGQAQTVLSETPARNAGTRSTGGVSPAKNADTATETVKDKDDSSPTDSGGDSNTEKVYRITDFYDKNGKLSALGSSLEQRNGERVLTVSRGDRFVVGDRVYEVAKAKLVVSFYTQPSLNRVLEWWVDFFDAASSNGSVIVVTN